MENQRKTSKEANNNSENQFKMTSYYILKKTSDGQFMFVLRAGNNETILVSERYQNRSGAINGIKSVQENSQKLSRFEKLISETDKDEPYYFVLKARNGEPIGHSENYPTEQIRDKGIDSVHRNGCTTRIKDEINGTEIICLEIVVNGREKEWDKNQISFEELVVLAFGSVINNPNRCYTVTYSSGNQSIPGGVMVAGNRINVKPKMIFNVTATDKS